MRAPRWREVLLALLALAVLAALIQAVPYGRRHTNPPVVAEPSWDSPETRALAVRACFDCHSNETRWPWYTSVAPVSWLAQHDVDEGRRELNFSEWNRAQREAREAAKTVRKHEMPPWYYWVPRAGERLTPTEEVALERGLAATFGTTTRGRRG